MVGTDVSYRSLGDVLERAGLLPVPAELHGEICGMMCSGGMDATRRWIEESLSECDDNTPEGRQAREQLREVEKDAWRSLTSTEMTFEPLLPDDDRPLEEQVRALAVWCQGFLAGLGLGGLAPRAEGAPQDEVSEVVADFAEISRATVTEEEAEAPEQSAFALAQVKEYVRVGVQIVFEELARVRAAHERESLH